MVNFIGVGGAAAAHSAAEVATLLDQNKPQGYVLAAEEFEHGVWELAVPVRAAEGRIVAALSVLGGRADLEKAAPGIAAVLRSASNRLGGAATVQE